MQTKALLKALRFVCLPTIAVFLLVVLAFASFSEAFTFMLSKGEGATALRIVLGLAEIGTMIVMYIHYLTQLQIEDNVRKNKEAEQEKKNEIKKKQEEFEKLLVENNGKLESIQDRHGALRQIFGIEHYDVKFEVYGTGNGATKLVRAISPK